MATRRRTYDLAERTARFAEDVVRFAKDLPKNAVTAPLIGQLVRSGTSIGANTCEANEAVSKKDFRNKIGLCRKEANETKYWLRMLACAQPKSAPAARVLWKEAHELVLIFAKSFRTCADPPQERRSSI